MNDARPLHLNRDVTRDPREYQAGAPQGRPSQPLSGKRPFEAKGHDKALFDAQTKKLMASIVTLGGETDSGHILRRDRYTVTLAHPDSPNHEIIYFKHALESISIAKAV